MEARIGRGTPKPRAMAIKLCTASMFGIIGSTTNVALPVTTWCPGGDGWGARGRLPSGGCRLPSGGHLPSGGGGGAPGWAWLGPRLSLLRLWLTQDLQRWGDFCST